MKVATALVTGGTRGLGRALVGALHCSGTRVWTVARHRKGIESLHQDCPGVEVIQGDLSSRGTPRRISRAIAASQLPLDLIIHNAAVLGKRLPLVLWSRQEFDRVLLVNLTAPFDLTRRLLVRCHANSTIVFISSGVTSAIRSEWGAYQISKVALENLALTFAKEVGPLGPRILVVDPGALRTAMRAAAYPTEDPSHLPSPESVAQRLVDIVEGGDWKSGDRITLSLP